MIAELTTERLILRKPDARDEQSFLDWYASPRRIAQRGPVDEITAWERFAAVVGHWTVRGFGRFMVTMRDTGKTVGLIGPHYPGGWPEPELGWHIWDDNCEGKGIAFEAAFASLIHARRALGLTSIVSLIAPDNTRSAKLAERLGATPDGEITFIEGGTHVIHRYPTGEAAS